MRTASVVTLGLDGLRSLVVLLKADGWTVLAPHESDGVVTHAPISGLDDLPRGRTDEQDAASYRLGHREDDALFGYVVGPQSWKSVLFPARELLRRSVPVDGSEGQDADASTAQAPRLALFGVRSCDLHAIEVHDRVLRDRSAQDTHYAARREAILVVAVTCSDPGGTCFCASMDTGPDPSAGFDLALTELLDDGATDSSCGPAARAGPTCSIGSTPPPRPTPTSPPPPRWSTPPVADGQVAGHDRPARPAVRQRRAPAVGRRREPLPGVQQLHDGVPHLLLHDGRPTRRASSTAPASAGGSGTPASPPSSPTSTAADVRSSTRSRYRQWATHKLASWWDQFGTSGCVGCGRCITWCPVAIDLTAEVAAIRASSAERPPGPEG